MGKKGGFRLGAFLKNTVLGIVFILICSTYVFKYIDTIYTKQNEKESVYELAKMISGKEITQQSIDHAKKLKEISV